MLKNIKVYVTVTMIEFVRLLLCDLRGDTYGVKK